MLCCMEVAAACYAANAWVVLLLADSARKRVAVMNSAMQVVER